MTVSCSARHCSHASLNVIHDRLLYGTQAPGPFRQREARRRPGLPQSAKGIAGPRSRLPPPSKHAPH